MTTPRKVVRHQHLDKFTTGFDLEAATTVVRVDDNLEPLLSQLRRRSRLEWDDTTRRYSVHKLVRALSTLYLGAAKEAVEQPYLLWSMQTSYRTWDAVTDPVMRADPCISAYIGQRITDDQWR